MKLATIRGHVTSTVKHESLCGWRLLLAQPVTRAGANDGPPQVVLDSLGAAMHQTVLISSDGAEARRMVGSELSPARWTVAGIVDQERTLAL